MIAIVCGGRDYRDQERVFAVLDQMKPTFVIHGGARGADALAENWAISRGVPYARVPAQWERYGRGAGQKRNGWMLQLKPDRVIAFPGGRGTAGMVEQADKAGFLVIKVEE